MPTKRRRERDNPKKEWEIAPKSAEHGATNAVKAVHEGMGVNRAAGVPKTTLKDRLSGRVQQDGSRR